MMFAALIWGAPTWVVPAAALAVVLIALIGWSYGRSPAQPWVRVLAALLKAAAVIGLAVCLVEPLFSGIRPRPGANLFLMLVDDSRSLQVKDANQRQTRAELVRAELAAKSDWQSRLDQDFDVRRYTFATRLRPMNDFEQLDFTGEGSGLHAALADISRRYQGRPTAGVLLWTDGNATDFSLPLDTGQLPPLYPVVAGADRPAKDVRVARASVTQTNFEIAPVTVTAEVHCQGYTGETIVLQLRDEQQREVQRQTLRCLGDDEPLVHRFQFRPDATGVTFYEVRAFAESQETQFERPERSDEATLANNSRTVMVDRGGGPYRVLYVSGRPNWEFKFLRRAIEEDVEVDLVGLIRIAKREPKFAFRDNRQPDANPLFRGFGEARDEETEEYDQPVLLRLGTRDDAELRDGFPVAADVLFQYHAIVIDDLEAGFFTKDQMSLIQEFVSHRGGGFLMLGGRESFTGGQYDRTPIADLLPVYLDRVAAAPPDAFRFALTREGLLQPWVRLRSTEQGEQQRLGEMPPFMTVNRVQTLKPGAVVLAHLDAADGQQYPGLVVQRFGKGRAAAMLIGDLWRWHLRQRRPDEQGLPQSWRQTIRWLVADVPGRIDVETRQPSPDKPLEIVIDVRDETFQPLDNAAVVIKIVTSPDEQEVELTAGPGDEQAGRYTTSFMPRTSGAYRGEAIATAPDGSEVGRREFGWVSQPETAEFGKLEPNRDALERLARKTGGEVIEPGRLGAFVSSLPNRKIPVTEPWVYPLWHQWPVFLFAAACLIGEWGLRRWKGLA